MPWQTPRDFQGGCQVRVEFGKDVTSLQGDTPEISANVYGKDYRDMRKSHPFSMHFFSSSPQFLEGGHQFSSGKNHK